MAKAGNKSEVFITAVVIVVLSLVISWRRQTLDSMTKDTETIAIMRDLQTAVEKSAEHYGGFLPGGSFDSDTVRPYMPGSVWPENPFERGTPAVVWGQRASRQGQISYVRDDSLGYKISGYGSKGAFTLVLTHHSWVTQ